MSYKIIFTNMGNRNCRKILLTLSALAVLALNVSAQKTWLPSGTGDWSDAANWSPSGTPTASTSYTYIGNSGTALLGANTAANSAAVAIGYNGDGALTVSGTLKSGNAGLIGYSAGTRGGVLIAGDGWWNITGGSLNFSVGHGDNSSGTLTLADRARLDSNNEARVAAGAGSRGDVTLGGSAQWTSDDTLSLGYGNSSAATLTLGGNARVTVSSGGAYIGSGGDSLGTLNLGGDAILTVRGKTRLGVGERSTGVANVTGNARLDITDSLNVGHHSTGAGELNISGRATVATGGNTDIGSSNAGVRGALTVSGSGFLTSGGCVGIGYNGAATAALSDSGSLRAATYISVADNSKSAATLTVSDNAAAIAGTYLEVAHSGSGRLDITGNGRVVAGTYVNIGDSSGSRGTLTVSGSGSLTAGGNFAIGNSGSGAVFLSDRASIQAGTLLVHRDGLLDLRLTPGRADAWLNVSSVSNNNLAGTLRVSGLGDSAAYARASQALADTHILINSAAAFTGTFANIVTGNTNLPDYLALTVGKTADNKQYRATAGLAWNAAANAHGNFTVSDASFELDVSLSDRAGTVSRAANWNGKSLVKNGAGTLIISAPQQYTGATTVSAGTLLVSDSGALAGDITVSGGNFANHGADLRGTLTLTSGTVSGVNYRGQHLAFTAGDHVLAPTGALTASRVTLSVAGVFELTISGIAVNDQLLTDTLTLPDGGFTLRLINSGLTDFDPNSNYDWTIATYHTLDGAADPQAFTIVAENFGGADPANFTVSAEGNALILHYQAVPEPTTWFLLLSAAALLTLSRAIRRVTKNHGGTEGR